jgi:hypothetical protein
LPSKEPHHLAGAAASARDEIRVGVERRTEADINSGTTPALGSYEGGGYERQDEGR